MCIICVHLDDKKLTPWEAAKNRVEYLDVLDDEHLKVLDLKIRESLLEYLDNLTEQNKQESQKSKQI